MTGTTHFNLTQPSIGNTTTWGLSLNNDLATIDSALWNASGGLTIGVNAPSVASSNIVLTNPMASIQQIAFSTTGFNVQLPVMNATASMVVGGVLTIQNVGSYAFEVFAQDGSTAVVTSVLPGEIVYLTLDTNSTANGTFTVNSGLSAGGTIAGNLVVTGTTELTGNVGIGTSAGTAALTISSTAYPTALLTSTGSHQANLQINNVAGNQGSVVEFLNAGTPQWTVGAGTTAGNWSLYDLVNSKVMINVTPGGDVSFGVSGTNLVDKYGNYAVGAGDAYAYNATYDSGTGWTYNANGYAQLLATDLSGNINFAVAPHGTAGASAPMSNVLSVQNAGYATTFTQSAGDNSTKLATTAYVDGNAVGGRNQSWQDVTGSRAYNTTYTNTTGRPICVMVYSNFSSLNCSFQLVVNGVNASKFQFNGNAPYVTSGWVGGIVPSGASYAVTESGGIPLNQWTELR